MTVAGRWSVRLPVPGVPDGMSLRTASAWTDDRLLCDWLNAPHVRKYWRLHIDRDPSGHYGARTVRSYLGALHDATDESGLIGEIHARPMSYWEVYDIAGSPLAGAPELGPADRGVHVLVGRPEYVGRGIGPHLIRAIADWQFARHPHCARVAAEPDVRNARAVKAFVRAGFRHTRELDLECKRAALMVLERPVP